MRTINNIVLTDPLSDDEELLSELRNAQKEKKHRGAKPRKKSAEIKLRAPAPEPAPAAKEAVSQAPAVPEAAEAPEEKEDLSEPEDNRREIPKMETEKLRDLPPLPELPQTPPQPPLTAVVVRRKVKKKTARAKGEITLRDVRPEDAAALAEIYAYYVERTAVTFETTAPDADEFRARIEEITKKYPFLVAERDGKPVGYAYAAPFKARAAYDCSVEVSVYLRRSVTRQGLGNRLYDELEFRLKEMAFTNAYACIAYPNAEDRYLDCGSVDFHTAMGYRLCGVFENCAVKFDTWYSMIWMGKKL